MRLIMRKLAMVVMTGVLAAGCKTLHGPEGSLHPDGKVAQSAQVLTDAGMTDTGQSACLPRSSIAGLCVIRIEGDGAFNNDSGPLQGTIVAIGDSEARPACFGGDNFGAAIPRAARAGEALQVPEGTAWWRVTDGSTVYSVAVAAPGLEALGVSAGDSVNIRHAVSWAGWDWPFGNAEIEIAGKGRVVIAVNDSSLLKITQGPASCERPGPCGGQEWSMRIAVDGESIEVPPFESVELGGSTFTNAGALTHRAEYKEPEEGFEGVPGCKAEPRTTFVATRVQKL